VRYLRQREDHAGTGGRRRAALPDADEGIDPGQQAGDQHRRARRYASVAGHRISAARISRYATVQEEGRRCRGPEYCDRPGRFRLCGAELQSVSVEDAGGKQKHMVEMFKGAIQHKGFALVDVFSPCVTYNKDNTYQRFNPRVKILEEQGHDPTDLHKAIDRGYQWGEEIPIGLFWRRTDLETLEEQEPVLHTGEGPLAFRRNLGIAPDQAKGLVNELL
jgi:Pyruvate ferredoxin oxidoreductase beta subunit C terminal